MIRNSTAFPLVPLSGQTSNFSLLCATSMTLM